VITLSRDEALKGAELSAEFGALRGVVVFLICLVLIVIFVFLQMYWYIIPVAVVMVLAVYVMIKATSYSEVYREERARASAED